MATRRKRQKHKFFLIFLGPPGSGKDTQAKKLTVAFRLPFFSPGKLFRREVKADTVLGKEIAPVMARGGLIGNRIVSELVDKFLGKKEAQAGAVFDGYPRTITQMRSLQRKLDRMTNGPHEIYAILIDVSEKEVKKRLTNRRRLRLRRDDRPEVIAERLAIYRRHIKPVLNFLKKHHELLKVNGEQSIKEVEKDIKMLLTKHDILA